MAEGRFLSVRPGDAQHPRTLKVHVRFVPHVAQGGDEVGVAAQAVQGQVEERSRLARFGERCQHPRRGGRRSARLARVQHLH